jgi:hypothetical protein
MCAPSQAEPRRAADALQLTLRFSFQARLTPSVRCPSSNSLFLKHSEPET